MGILLRLANRLKQRILTTKPRNHQRRHSHATGLYGFHHLKTPNGFHRFVDDAIQRSEELIQYVSAMPSSAEVIKAMDEISDTVCCVVDSAELCRNTHPDRVLNTNHTLYDAVKKAERDGSVLTEEAQWAAHYLQVDFEKGSIHLPAGKLDRLNQLNKDNAQLGRKFNENIITDPGHVDVFPASRIPKHLHRLLKPVDCVISANSTGLIDSRGNKKHQGFRITTEPRTLSSVLQWVPDEEVRKMAYIQGNSVPHANRVVLDELIAARHELAEAKHGACAEEEKPFITFVLGGPGSGKGTQCAKIVDTFGFLHMSAGDLLRREIASNSKYGTMILDTIKRGKIVPSEVTVKLIQKEMESSDSLKFLIDGFPRTEENRMAFERIVGAKPDIVLFFDCPEEEMVNRVLNRNQGRVDDNIETIKKRLEVFSALSLPVIEYYSKKRKLYKINAIGSEDEIFEQVRPVFAALQLAGSF